MKTTSTLMALAGALVLAGCQVEPAQSSSPEVSVQQKAGEGKCGAASQAGKAAEGKCGEGKCGSK
ncbi:hypothetical protein BWD09_02225 [Neisseria dentiae]|uniref:Lipoprotein n=1 Tax=Neisseria dentiae TaxID=194197 RepID=A0A1X3DFB2_9NEIS|nr:hypothetical protein [Neisseria dentiae]OSI18603.1 hypothetical protein BWD09_02225 [Neisseria dentiae]QMT45505.1 hypothetical protein H3L92_01385 [Neisseria dentiae]STZ51397.1 Uncharacterized low-complexity protein [Neisseria dentiae]